MPLIYYALFAASVIPILLAWLSGYLRYRDFGHLDNNHPREQQGKQTGVGARAVAAQNNAWEALIVFLLVTFIAYASGVDMAGLSAVGLAFVFLRLLHAAFYLANLGSLRSVAYLAANLCCIYIFVVSAIGYR
jgi:uncharacterized MAPEG superfamily protein